MNSQLGTGKCNLYFGKILGQLYYGFTAVTEAVNSATRIEKATVSVASLPLTMQLLLLSLLISIKDNSATP